ncbi:methyltransferase domain-containing protein [Candidatus Micrarchaeota archaeon]|nr:methyltransferase domain-containing protein [Candidatus Micrarchaeota archaeon]
MNYQLEHNEALRFLGDYRTRADIRHHAEFEAHDPNLYRESDYLEPIHYVHVLAELMGQWDPKPKAGEPYSTRIRRVLKGKRILEVGARYGTFVEFLNRHGAKANGIDSNHEAVKMANTHGINVIHGRAETHAPEEKYDAVVSHQVLDRWYWGHETPTAFINHITTMLKPGGLSVHTVFGQDALSLEESDLRKAGMQSLFLGHREKWTEISVSKKPQHR